MIPLTFMFLQVWCRWNHGDGVQTPRKKTLAAACVFVFCCVRWYAHMQIYALTFWSARKHCGSKAIFFLLPSWSSWQNSGEAVPVCRFQNGEKLIVGPWWTMVDHVGHEIRDDPRYPRRSPPTSKRSMEVGADPGVTFLKAAHFSMTHIGPYISLDNIIIYHNIPMYPKIADPISENHRGSA